MNDGMAAIERGVVAAKYAYRNGYGIVFNGKRYSINRSSYKVLQKGEEIEIHYAPRSRQVFTIKNETGVIFGDG